MKDSRYYLGIINIILLYLFVLFFYFINEPIGDDVLGYFTGSLTFYLDEFDFNLGTPIDNISKAFDRVEFAYTYWSGRMTGYMLASFGPLLTRWIQAMLVSGILIGNVLLSMKIIYGSFSNCFRNSVVLTLVFLISYWYRPGTFYTYMWTMVSIYSFATLLVLLYYNLAVVDRDKGKVYNKYVLGFVGFLAGISHEVISLLLIILILIKTIFNKKRKQLEIHKISCAFKHWTLFLGYFCGVFSPGNFNRIHQSHDIVNKTIIEQLFNSFLRHSYVVLGNGIIVYILIISLIIIYYLNKRHISEMMIIFYDSIELIFVSLASILIYSLFPRTPIYGLELFLFIVLIILIKSIIYLTENMVFIKYLWNRFYYCILLVTVIIPLSFHFNEVNSYFNVALQRHVIIENAKNNNQETVFVPYYPDTLSTRRYLIGYLNGQQHYDSIYYRTYYGIHILLNDTGNKGISSNFDK